MAWKFRKRIKIAPGVNINISRGGISTTIGPKGASVNIGKKGAYLNTGVPGTGLYDRQKISNNPMNNQTNKGDGGYSGCILFIVILGVLLFCCFGLLKAISVISFIACLIVAALLSLIITLSNSEKSSGANTNTSDSSPVANPSTETEIQTPQTNAPTRQFAGLKEESFILLQTESSALYLFLKSASRSIKVRKELDRMMDLTNSDGTPWPLNNKISLSMLIDAYRCYTDLGYHMDHGEDEELGLLLFAAKVANPDAYLSYYNLEKFRITAAHSVRGTFDVAINVNRQISIPSGQYIFQHVLENVDKERMSEYMVALYRFASAIAKADGTIDARESVILANLMKAKDITTDGQLIHEVKESSQSKKKAKDDLITTEENVQDKENDSQSELHDLIGLSSVKEEVEKLSNYIKIMNVRKGKGLPTSEISYHCVFTGNPGTGKTTVARIIAGIYKQ